MVSMPDNPLSDRPDILGRSPGFLNALDTARRVSGTDLGVLLSGETGVGKEIFAQFIHRRSGRAGGPFVAVNCGAIPGELVYSELFGYSEGAFTGASRGGHAGKFEQASGGTLFLDEIGDAPLEVQLGLLRVLEESVVYRLGSVKPVPVNVRVLAASSRDLPVFVKEGLFRMDLYYRLAGVTINIPPLRDRREDIPLLAEYFLKAAAEKAGRSLLLGGDARQGLLNYNWPGNVRELKNTMFRLAALADGGVVDGEALVRWGPAGPAGGKAEERAGKDSLARAIEEAGGNMARAARILGVDRSTLYRRMKRLGIKN
jgi:transcriptional regulator with PAS, ATPase and Fis domain